MSHLLAGVDLGGTKIEVLAMRPDGEEVLRLRRPTPRGDYEATLDQIAGLIDDLGAATGDAPDRVGVGIPGSPSPTSGLVRNANSTWLNGRPFEAELARRLNRPVRVANDANCLALSEARDGAAAGANSVFAVILGTGVGGGLVVNGRIVEGAHGIGAEWGHIPLPGAPGDAAPCFCGRRDCIETYLSGPGLVADFVRLGGDAARVEDVVVASEAGDATAHSVLERHLDRLGQALGLIVNIIDPEVIVLGGGVSRLPGLVDRLPEVLAPHVFLPARDLDLPRIALSAFGDSSGVRGAARLWEDKR
jgi:fructokinase